MSIDPKKKYSATIDTTKGPIVVDLFADRAPATVNNFVFLANEKFYDGIKFHRVIADFMVQGGDPTGTGMGGPGYKVKAEFNKTKHTRGVLSAARSSDPNSAGSQFFVMHDTAPHLDGQYSAFGKVTSGLEVVDKIVGAPRDGNDRPRKPASITSITITEA